MAYYRVYLLDAANHITNGQGIDRGGDDEAIPTAAALINDSPAVELWIGTRMVAHLTAEDLERQRVEASSSARPRLAPLPIVH
jgi:hypothetical protein